MKRLAVALLLYAWPLVAQQASTAELIGSVGSAGQKLPGVSVTLASDVLQGTRSALTGENGGYRFPLLPPGDYRVRFDLQGFTAVEQRVHLSLTEVARVDVQLIAAALREEMTVSADGRPAGAAIGIDVDRKTLQRLPGPRDIRAAVDLSPSANTLGNRGGLVIAGAPSWDSLYLVDGIATGEYLSGQPHNVVLEDAIQEIVVLTGAISAEYGRFTGGVVSALTKSGGNEFSASLRDTMSNPAWTAATPWAGQIRPRSRTNDAFEATAGGFIVKDRLWFFAASRHAEATTSRFTSQTNIPYPSSSRDVRWETKLTHQLTAQHALILSYDDASMREKNVTDTRTSGIVLDLGALITDRSQPTRLLSVAYEGVPLPNTAVELQASQKRYALRGNGGRASDRIAGTLIVAPNGNMYSPFGCGICGDDERDSKSAEAKLSKYLNTRWGNHTAVGGAAFFAERRTNAATRSSSGFNIQSGLPRIVGQTAYPFFGPGTGIVWTEHFHGDRGSRLNTTSAYGNDRWEIGSRTTINIGLRYDRNHAKEAAGSVISDDAALSPRLSATYDPRGDGHQLLLASFGRYSSRILEGGGGNQQVGVFNQFAWRYAGPTINGQNVRADELLPAAEALRRLFDWFDSVGGLNNRQYLQFITTPNAGVVFNGRLKSPSVDERSIGYAMHWPAGSVRADFIARDWHNFYASRIDRTTGQQTNPFGQTVDVAWIVNDNSGTMRKYRALQIEGSLRGARMRVGGGYTWSRLRGNDDEEEPGLGAPRNYPLSLWYPEIAGYAQRRPVGYLRQDERHRARVWLGYELGPLSAFVAQRFDSGHPYSAQGDVDPKSVAVNPGYILNQLATTPYYFSGRGEFRTDDVWSTDVSVRYDFTVRGPRVFVKGDVLNAFNRSAVVAPNSDVATARTGTGLATFNPFTQTPVEGVNFRPSQNFGKPTGPESYQTPRTFQVAVGVRF